MSSRPDCAACLGDIIENSGRIADYIGSMDIADFERNGLVRDAVERCLERICEAAHRLGPEAAHLLPDQPWADIRGMGNRLRHGYDRITVSIVWQVARERLPHLKAKAELALQTIG